MGQVVNNGGLLIQAVNNAIIPEDESPLTTECDGAQCSTDRIHHPCCAVKLIQLPDLEEINNDCFFGDKHKPVADMPNRLKRCMTYWWIATNVYSIVRRGNREPLADCIIAWVRSLYPEEDPNDYVGFKEVVNDEHATESEEEDSQ